MRSHTDKRCFPGAQALDAAADGYGRAEAAGVLVLAPIDDAIVPLAILDAVSTNQDGRSSSLTAPMGTC